jgi:hypothetical protein
VGNEGAVISWSKYSNDSDLLCIAGPEGVVIFDSTKQCVGEVVSSHCSSRCADWSMSSPSLVIAEPSKLLNMEIIVGDGSIRSKLLSEFTAPLGATAGPIRFVHTVSDDSVFLGTKKGSCSELYECNLKTKKVTSFGDDVCARGYEDRSSRLKAAFHYMMCDIKPW